MLLIAEFPWFFLAAVCAAVFGVMAFYRALAVRFGWVDHANHRSSHVGSTPRGAGIVFATVLLIGGLADSDKVFNPLLLGGALVAMTGWVDDLRGVSSRLRFAIYGMAIGFAVACDGLADWRGAAGNVRLLLLIVGVCVVFAWLWLTNLYNFMDGINGIAAWEAVAVLVSAFLIDVLAGESSRLAALTIAVLLGFLPWNFPRARVFMGDAGSAFLGFWLGGFAFIAARTELLLVVVWAILLGGFIVDATWTLLYRISSGQVWHQSHRSHLYQRLAQRWQSHAQVDLLLLAVNVLWLLPWAAAVRYRYITPAAGLSAAYLPLLYACWHLGAGKRT